MPDPHRKPEEPMHWIGKVLAALLTIAIVVVVFWNTHPFGGDAPDPDRPQPPSLDGSTGDLGDYRGRMAATVGPVVMETTGTPADAFYFRVRPFGLMDENMRAAFRAQRVLLQSPDAAKAIDLSPDQQKQLEAIDPPTMVIGDTDRAALEDLWRAWERADDSQKPAAKTAVIEALRAAGKKGLDPTKKAWVDAAASIQKTLTLQQQAKLAVWEDANPQQNFGRGGWGFGPSTQRRWER